MNLKLLCVALAMLVVAAGTIALRSVLADAKPTVQLKTDKSTPREVEDTTEKSILRDYSSAWQAMEQALSDNDLSTVGQNFAGFALEKLKQRVKDQQKNGLTTRIIDRGHKVDAIFYSPDGSALELRDTASIETQVLDGGTVIHSDQSQIQYFAVMTPDADRWKLRVLESAPQQ